MQAYLINLDRSPGRLAEADAQLRAAGQAYARVPAVDGQALTARERGGFGARLRYKLVSHRWPRPTELACALSHQRVYRRMIEAGDARALVFEDDVEIPDPAWFREALARIEADDDPAVPTAWRLDRWPTEPPTPARGLFPAVLGKGDGACAYVLNQPGARLLARLNTPPLAIADSWSRWARLGLRVRMIRPEPCRQSGAESTIGYDWRPPRRATWGWYVALWNLRQRLWRPVETALDALLIRITGR